MRMSRSSLIGLLSAAAMVGAISGPIGTPFALGEDPSAADRNNGGSASLEQIRALSSASQELYRRIAPSIIRVRVDISGANMVPPHIRREFNEWKRTNGMPPTSGTNREGLHEEQGPREGTAWEPGSVRGIPAPDAKMEPRHSFRAAVKNQELAESATQPATRQPTNQPELVLLRQFLEARRSGTPNDPEAFARARLTIERLDALRAGQTPDVSAVVFDNQGHALALCPLFTDEKHPTLTVTLPDGGSTTATVVGNDYFHGLSVLKLEKADTVPSLPRATTGPNPGEIMMAISANQGAPEWLMAGSTEPNHHFVMGSDEHGSHYLFSTDGQFCGILANNRGTAVSGLWRDVESIMATGHAAKRPSLGVRYSYVPLNSPMRTTYPALGTRMAVHVDEIAPGSPADKAGLKKDDFVLTLANQPIIRLQAIVEEMSAEPTNLTMGILRDGKDMAIQVSLK